MARWKIEHEEKPNPLDVRYVIGQLEEFNQRNSPTPFERKDVRLFVRDDEGKVLAGLFGAITMHCLVIQIMWVEDQMRGQGLGTALVERATEIAQEVGARQIIVETTSFQAPEFYQKLGFQVICEIPDCPVGAVSLLMRKNC